MAHDRSARPVLTAREAGLLGCGTCGCVSAPGIDTCPRCGNDLQSRAPHSLERVWAWWFAGLIAYIPANLYPMLKTEFLGRESRSTIVGGVIELLHHGSYAVAGIVFLASVMIPVSKFFTLAYLAISIRQHSNLTKHRRTVLYEIVEFIGRWSMVDVFVVAILAALVNLGFVMGFEPGTAALFFALSVAFTMISALSLDPRLIWDAALPKEDSNDGPAAASTGD
jgi:paraquat-inducible protein A